MGVDGSKMRKKDSSLLICAEGGHCTFILLKSHTFQLETIKKRTKTQFFKTKSFSFAKLTE